MRNVLTTCVYCGCGCGLYLEEGHGRALLQLNPDDAARVKAEVTDMVVPDAAYTTFHLPEAPINLLTSGAQERKSGCPENMELS